MAKGLCTGVKNRVLSTAALAALILTALSGARTPAAHRADLSGDLQRFLDRSGTAATRVIVPGTRAEIVTLAARHHLTVMRWLGDGAVVAASREEIEDLAADSAVGHLSGDPLVAAATEVETQSTGADQTWAGTRGGLGLGSVPGVTGVGVGVAVVDSGISPHRALLNKVVANVSFVTGDPSVSDAFGHGTHVAGIIAGTESAAAGVTSAYGGGLRPARS